jgi:hypothetical protein
MRFQKMLISLILGASLCACGGNDVLNRFEVLTKTPLPTVFLTSTKTIDPSKTEEMKLTLSPTIVGEQVTITGWFTTIWNEKPHYYMTDEQGRRYQLIFPKDVTQPFGGPLALDRKELKIVGEKMDKPSGTIRVLSIQIMNDE